MYLNRNEVTGIIQYNVLNCIAMSFFILLPFKICFAADDVHSSFQFISNTVVFIMALRVYAQEIKDEKSQQRSWNQIVQEIAMGALLCITLLWLTYIYCYRNDTAYRMH